MKTPNTLYLSNYLNNDYPELFACISNILKKHHIALKTLHSTKDIWVRDFMPLRIKNHYLQYHYTPDYLKKSPSYQTDTASPVEELGLRTKHINLILDGGNLVSFEDTIIMTDKIYQENKSLTKEELTSHFCDFKNIIVIPWDKKEKYGHADGMVRFIDKNHVLVNSLYEEAFKEQFHAILKKHKLKITELHIPKNKSCSWGYINYLQIQELIIQPSIDQENDAVVKSQLEALFPSSTVVLCDATKLIEEGGVFNCISWEDYDETL